MIVLMLVVHRKNSSVFNKKFYEGGVTKTRTRRTNMSFYFLDNPQIRVPRYFKSIEDKREKLAKDYYAKRVKVPCMSSFLIINSLLSPFRT